MGSSKNKETTIQQKCNEKLDQCIDFVTDKVQGKKLDDEARTSAKWVLLVASIAVTLYFRHVIYLSVWFITGSGLYFPPSPAISSLMDAVLYTEIALGGVPSGVPEVHYFDRSNYTTDNLWRRAKSMTETAVVRGLFADTGAANWGSEEWVAKYGGQKVNTVVKVDESAHTWQKYYTWADSTLGDVDADIQKGISRVTYGLDELFIKNPHLLKDVEIDRFGYGTDEQFCRQFGMLYGKAGAGKSGGLMWHNAGTSNFLIQQSGYKKVFLINTAHSVFMKPVLAGQFDSGFLASSGYDIIDQMPMTEVLLAPGDALQFPSWVWHSTQTVDAPEGLPTRLAGAEERLDKISIGLTCRFSTAIAAMSNAPLMEFYRSFGWKYGIPLYMPFWGKYVPFARLMVDGYNHFTSSAPAWNDLSDCWSSKRAACAAQGVVEAVA